MTKKKSIVKPTDKELLPESNSVVVDGVGADKSVATGGKLKIIHSGAIITTTPIDTVNEIVNIAKDVAPLVIMLIKERIEQKKKKDDDNRTPEKNIEVSGDNNNVQIQNNNYTNCHFHNGNTEKKK